VSAYEDFPVIAAPRTCFDRRSNRDRRPSGNPGPFGLHGERVSNARLGKSAPRHPHREPVRGQTSYTATILGWWLAAQS